VRNEAWSPCRHLNSSPPRAPFRWRGRNIHDGHARHDPNAVRAFLSHGWKIENAVDGVLFGLSFSATPDGFRYAVEVDPLGGVPGGACSIESAAGTYAVSHNRGPVKGLPAVFDAIFCQWLPASGQRQVEGIVFETPGRSTRQGWRHAHEIWLPVIVPVSGKANFLENSPTAIFSRKN